MIFKIFKKELIDTLRDRRTIVMMVLIPMLIFPLIMTVVSKISSSFEEETKTKALQIGYFSDDNTELFLSKMNELPENLGKKNIIPFRDTNEIKEYIKNDSIELGFYIPSNFSLIDDSLINVPVKIFFKASNLGISDRAEVYLDFINGKVQEGRFNKLNIKREQLEPIKKEFINIASDKETIGKLIGGFLPYLFIAFGFMGCMYPAIDLFTGEKERGTLETLLTTPVARWKILFGKMLVVVLSGLLAASFTLFGIFLSIEVFHVISEPKILDMIHELLTAKFLIMFYLILLPLIIFFAGVMIPIAVYAKTFKEAQSVIAPMNALVVLPAMVGFFPGIELNVVTASIPIINVVLATKELIAGTLDILLLLQSVGIMLFIALVMVSLSYKRFGKETNLVV